MTQIFQAKIINPKPIVSYFPGNDATKQWEHNLTEVNVIRTKVLTPDFVQWCIVNKNKVFLHIVISGMGKTQFEPNIPTVKIMFEYLKILISNGFPQKQILIIIDPIVQNNNGLKALQLLLKLFTEYRDLRLRFIRFNTLKYRKSVESDRTKVFNQYTEKTSYVVSNPNITRRFEFKKIAIFLRHDSNFYKELIILKRKYENIISIDHDTEPLIGVRELMAFGYNNSWNYPDGRVDKIIHYKDGNKFKPIVNELSSTYRCSNRCLLCTFRN